MLCIFNELTPECRFFDKLQMCSELARFVSFFLVGMPLDLEAPFTRQTCQTARKFLRVYFARTTRTRMKRENVWIPRVAEYRVRESHTARVFPGVLMCKKQKKTPQISAADVENLDVIYSPPQRNDTRRKGFNK